MEEKYHKAVEILTSANRVVAFTGAWISVESGIPPFRGPAGLWSRYNPMILDIHCFRKNPLKSWQAIKEIFYDYFGQAKANKAHHILAKWERQGLIKAIIAQNIDHLHQEAGSEKVYEFHGTSQILICNQCQHRLPVSKVDLQQLPPTCSECGGIMRPDFVFFGEPIPEPANNLSFQEAEKADVFIVIGTTGEIMLASLIPQLAKQKGATIIEINPQETNFAREITDVYLNEKATIALSILDEILET